MHRLCHDRPLFTDTLDAVKFVCKDLWSTCWDKQVDNLRTNHRVSTVYPLHLRPFTYIHLIGCVCAPRQLVQTDKSTIELGRESRRDKTRKTCTCLTSVPFYPSISSTYAVRRHAWRYHQRRVDSAGIPNNCRARDHTATAMYVPFSNLWRRDTDFLGSSGTFQVKLPKGA